ncbi:MAG: sulfotransferase [Candidatus Udaeobacter sp.]
MTLRVENPEMDEQINKPIFVVGSPRSGTSILAWCLGHHPNIFPVPESNWMGDFALNLAIAHQIGSARGGLSILSAMDIRDDEFFAAFGRSVNDLVLGHRRRLEINRENSNSRSKVNQRWLEATSMAAGPKTRWVDGTPEYSLHICGLRKLFPEARFVHLFRDVDAVVRSMLNFHRATGIQLVATEEEAYRYWLRMVDACLKAEQSYGPRVVYRLPYAALVDNPEAAMRSLLGFVEEPYSAKCLEPLAQRINSSNVSADFKSGDPATDPKVVEAARRLYVQIQQTPQPAEASRIVADQLEAAFQEPYLRSSRLQQELAEQIASRQHYAAEVERYKSQLARQEEHYTGEIDVLKSQLARQEQHYTNEIDVLNSHVTRQEQHYTGEIDVLESQIEKYKAKLDSLHTTITNLSRLLDNVQKAAERLANSRRWRLANVGTVIRAKLSGDKISTGYDPLDKIVAAYSRWRASHGEIGKLG